MDFAQVVKELQAITMAQQESQESITKAINQLSKVIVMATDEGFDVTAVVAAIDGLKDKLSEKEKMKILVDYQIDFDRDKHGLMKTGIRLSAKPQRLN